MKQCQQVEVAEVNDKTDVIMAYHMIQDIPQFLAISMVRYGCAPHSI